MQNHFCSTAFYGYQTNLTLELTTSFTPHNTYSELHPSQRVTQSFSRLKCYLLTSNLLKIFVSSITQTLRLSKFIIEILRLQNSCCSDLPNLEAVSGLIILQLFTSIQTSYTPFKFVHIPTSFTSCNINPNLQASAISSGLIIPQLFTGFYINFTPFKFL